MIRITVPATSANLGIGYDTLGMAVSLYSHFTFDRAETLTITGCPEQFQNEDNLVYESFVNALAEWGEKTFPVSIDISTEVPVARGRGTSRQRGSCHLGRSRLLVHAERRAPPLLAL